MMRYAVFKTHLGWAALVATEKGIVRLYLPRAGRKELIHYLLAEYPGARPDGQGLKKAIGQVQYFLARRRQSLKLQLDCRGLPSFHKRVYAVLAKIPYGQTRTYAWVAKSCGRPRAARAVGNALARNPFPLIVPCHRVIRSDGKLGGFAAGTEVKSALLNLEKAFHKSQESGIGPVQLKEGRGLPPHRRIKEPF